MNKKFLTFFIILFISLYCINTSYVFADDDFTNPFGNVDNTVSNIDTENSITNRAEEGGNIAMGLNTLTNLDALNSALETFFEYVRYFIAILSTFGTISSFLMLSMAFIRLANPPEASFQRRHVYFDILRNGLCAIAFGGLSLLMTVFYKTFAGFITNTIMISSDWKSAIGYALIEYKYLICGVCGVLSLTMLVVFIKDILELAFKSGNSRDRAQQIKEIVFTGVGTIGMGGVGVIVAIFNNILK